MKEKAFIAKYLGTPVRITFALFLSFIFIFVFFLLIGVFSNYSTLGSDKESDYVNYKGKNYAAGEKVYLDFSGIQGQPCYSDGEHDYYIVLDEGIVENEDWYYYIISVDDAIYNKLDVQKDFYVRKTDVVAPYRVYGIAIRPSSDFQKAVLEKLDLQDKEFASYFGTTYLLTNEHRQSPLAILFSVLLLADIGAFILLAIKYFERKQQVKKTLNQLNQLDYLIPAAGELGSSFATGQDPLLTDNYLFNKDAATVTNLNDIWLVYAKKNKLIGKDRFSAVHPLANNNNNNIHQKIIDVLKEKNLLLLVGDQAENIQQYQEMLKTRIDDDERETTSSI